MNEKNVRNFEKKLVRLFHLGQPKEWITLCDSEDKITLLFEVISFKDIDYMKEKYGWDIREILSREPKTALLMVIQNEPRKLLHVFDREHDFDISMIPELTDTYAISEYTSLQGARLLFDNQTAIKLFIILIVALMLISVILIEFM